ncbi:D-lactate dehydrogenase [Allopseudospirillum japonicum]|uniref:D-lactate dehydrogenase (cytochrome) n=1 Tax=Allopseudospirillum japonicum TaxID=64971 RepID=A0A1H6RIE2_9GAMM|nr:FAD-binding and (Fe-S)-binding domain-containing protein [Allopseudospirillum japonicum]SEI55523.1 D-lactate dehydrogenase [Allopseudospirillum japonicum]
MRPEYAAFVQQMLEVIPEARVKTDLLSRLALGTDASFYRLVPQVVVLVETETEVQAVLKACHQHQLAVTFRAAGTSLSGQAVTDSVLMVLGHHGWRHHQILQEGQQIRLQPAIIGAQANQYLAPYGRKIGPDPASINACMIGGIVANNASGMCCGTAHNTYHTVQAMRFILADGTLVDTQEIQSVARFRQTHADLLAKLGQLRQQILENPDLLAKINHKYRLKNTTGYSLNALVDFSDPLDILLHVLVGSEGTLGFISEITYQTVPEPHYKAAALILFADIEAACQATASLKSTPVAAVELMDRAALRAIQDKPGMPEYLRTLEADVTALLVDVRASTQPELTQHLQQVEAVLHDFALVRPLAFTQDAATYALYWNIRKGLFPAVGAVRQTGTTVIIEDVAFPIDKLAAGVRALQEVFRKYAYHEALLFGHALEGNLHFVFTQGFDSDQEVRRYQALMDEVADLVAVRFGGSLKAEHGTGRNMAPYVELEWGQDAYQLMWALKACLDPQHLLNPEVILSRNPQIHLQALKALPQAYQRVDACIECGFCEAVCPSRKLTLTPRQRIVILREMAALRAQASKTDDLRLLEKDFQYAGIDTCAGDSLCSTRCPVGIDTGQMIRELRAQANAKYAPLAQAISHHYQWAQLGLRWGLALWQQIPKVKKSPSPVQYYPSQNQQAQARRPALPQPVPAKTRQRLAASAHTDFKDTDIGLVYWPSCASRTLGAAADAHNTRCVADVFLDLCARAQIPVRVVKDLEGDCCGMPFHSKGHFAAAEASRTRVWQKLLDASEQGRWPIVCDTSPCSMRLLATCPEPVRLYDLPQALTDLLLPRLQVRPLARKIALHVSCSATHNGQAATMYQLASACAQEVVIPEGISCCGFAGDKGFSLPELNASALQGLAPQVADCDAGYSSSRTCELGLSEHTGIPYQSLVYLLEEASRG